MLKEEGMLAASPPLYLLTLPFSADFGDSWQY